MYIYYIYMYLFWVVLDICVYTYIYIYILNFSRILYIYIHKQLCIITSFVHTFHSGIPWNIYRWSYSHFWMIPLKKKTSLQWRQNRSQHDPGKVPYLIIRPCKHIILPEKKSETHNKPKIWEWFQSYIFMIMIILVMVYWVYHFSPIYGWYMTKW